MPVPGKGFNWHCSGEDNIVYCIAPTARMDCDEKEVLCAPVCLVSCTLLFMQANNSLYILSCCFLEGCSRGEENQYPSADVSKEKSFLVKYFNNDNKNICILTFFMQIFSQQEKKNVVVLIHKLRRFALKRRGCFVHFIFRILFG